MERDPSPLDPYAWAVEFAQAEAAGDPEVDAWVVASGVDEKAFVSASVRYSFWPEGVAQEKATEVLGGAEGVQEVEGMLAGAADSAEQRAILARMSPSHRAAFMEIAGRKIQALMATEEQA